MKRIARKSDGRRIFTDDFKREQIGRVVRGELTLGELSEKLGIARSLLHRWKRFMPDGNASRSRPFAATRRGRATPSAQADHYINELQLLVGKQALEIELLRAELDALRRNRRRPSR